MKKKLTAIFLTLVLLLASSLPTFASTTVGINSFLEKMLNIPADERESYIILMIPMLMVDSGVEDLQKSVRNYQEGGQNGIFGDYIGKILKYTEKDVLINSLETIKCTNITARRNFLEALRNKVPMTISSEAETAINTLLSGVYENTPALETLLEEGGYNEEVVAKLLSCIVEINGSKPLYIYDGNSFSAGTVYSDLADSVNGVWSDYVITENGLEKNESGKTGKTIDLNEMLVLSAETLNNQIPAEDRKLIATGLSETGIVKIQKSDKPIGGTDTGEGNQQPVEPIKPDVTVEVEAFEGKTKTVSFDTDMRRPMLYKKDGENLVIVKYSAYHKGKLVAKVSESGTYVIKDTPQKFDDTEGWAKDYIEMLAARGIINGKADNLYMPNETITREEFVKLIVELLDIKQSDAESIFADVDKNAWYAGYVTAAYENNIINGVGETEFGVGEPIRRQDMAKIISTVLEIKGIKAEPAEENVFVDYSNISDYAKHHVLSIYNMGIISGDENRNFNPNNFATRAEAAKMVYGMLVQIILN